MHQKTVSIQGNFSPQIKLVHDSSDSISPGTGGHEAAVQEVSDTEILNWLQQHAAQLPVIAVAVYEALDLLSARTIDLEKLAAVVGNEPALAAQVLRLAAADTSNGWYSLKEALVLVGVVDIQQLLIEVPLVTSLDPDYTRLALFRRHAQLTALLAETIAFECSYRRPEEARLAGLLHQLGTLLGLTQAGEPPADRVRIGGVLASWWGFPENLQDVIRRKHDSRTAGNFLVQAVFFAADYCARLGVLPDRGGVPNHDVKSIEVVRQHLPLLPPHRQTALAEAIDSVFTRWAAQFPESAANTGPSCPKGACL